MHSEWQLRRLDMKVGVGECDRSDHASHYVKLVLLAIFVHELGESANQS